MNRKTVILMTMVLCVATILATAATYQLTILFTAPTLIRQGYELGLSDMQASLDKAGVFTSWKLNDNGSYSITVLDGTGRWVYNTRFDLVVQHYRNGVLLGQSMHAMSVTNYGKDWVEQQLFNPNATTKALYLSTSANTSAFDATWVILPNEKTADGLQRAVGSYSSTGVGAANVTNTFSVTNTHSTQLYGVNAGAYATDPNTLVAAEQQGAGAVKNLINGDSLVLTIQWSHP